MYQKAIHYAVVRHAYLEQSYFIKGYIQNTIRNHTPI